MTITPQYLAGMVDADGHVIWRGGKHQAPTIGVTNCDTRLMAALKADLGGSVSIQRRAHLNRRDTYKWAIVGERAAVVLRAIRPYMIVKGERADDVLAQFERATATMKRPARRLHHRDKERAAMAGKGWD